MKALPRSPLRRPRFLAALCGVLCFGLPLVLDSPILHSAKRRQGTPTQMTFSSPTIAQGATSATFTITFAIGTANPDRPSSVQLEIPVDPAVVDMDGVFAIDGGPAIPPPPAYNPSNLLFEALPPNGMRILLFPNDSQSTRLNSGTNLFCTCTIPIRPTAPAGTYPLNVSSTGIFFSQLLQAEDDGGNTIEFNSTAGTLTITPSGNCPAITVSPETLPAGTVGTAYSQTITATGGAGPYTFMVTNGTLPPGLNLASNGTLSGTPNTPGNYPFTVGAKDSNNCPGTRSYTMTINSAACPTIAVTPTTLPNGTAGVAYSQTLTATGGTGPYTFAVTSGTLPGGLTLSTGGVISGTPSVGGSASFTVRATDSNNCTGTQSYTLTIAGSGGCPTINVTPTTLPNGTVGVAYSQTLTATGGTGPYTFAVTSGSLPGGLTLSTGGVISGTPSTGGSASFTVRATDSNNCSGERSYTVTVNAASCPTITLSPTTLPEGTVNSAYTQTITASGGAAPYTFAVSSGTLPPGLTLGTNGGLSGTPTQAGTFSFVVTATASNNCAGNLSYSLTIGEVGSGCSITVSPGSLPGGTVGVFYTQNLTASGGKAPYVFSITPNTLPKGLGLTSEGRITGIPTVTGTFNFAVIVNDSDQCSRSQPYTVAINRAADTQPPSVTVTAPKSGEKLLAGRPFTITWTSTDNVEVTRHNLSFSLDGGTSFTSIAEGLFGKSQEFTWMVPEIVTTRGRIRVTAFDAVGNAASALSPGDFSVSVPIPPNFELEIDPTSNNVPQGGATIFNVSMTTQGGFSQAVDLAAEAPSGVTVSFPSNPIPAGSSTSMIVSTKTDTPPGTYEITVKGTSGALTKSVKVTLEVQSAGDFTLSVTQPFREIKPSESAVFQITVLGQNGFAQPVRLTSSSSDPAFEAKLSAETVNPGQGADLTVTPKAGTPDGTATVTITGTSAGRTKTATVTVSVVNPGFSIQAQTPRVGTGRGKKGAVIILINRTGGFAGNVTITAPDKTSLKKAKMTITPATLTTNGDSAGFLYEIKSKGPEGQYLLTFTARDAAGNESRSDVLFIITE